MAKYKGIRWAQLLTLMSAIARTLTTSYVTKQELSAAAGNFKPTISGSTLVFPEGSTAKFVNSTLVLTE